MRKMISTLLSAALALTMCAAATTAFAADVNSPTASTIPDTSATTAPTTAPTTTAPSTTSSVSLPTLQEGMVNPTVNAEPSDEVSQVISPTNPNEVTFTYDGEGTLMDWEDNLAALGLVAGTDYVVTENEDGSYTMTLLTQAAVDQWNSGNVTLNAVVEFDEEDEEEEETKKNASSKSPATGVSATVLASVLAAGAGFAVLAASKKKDAE